MEYIIQDFEKKQPIVQRADGLCVHLNEISDLSQSDKELISAMFYLKIKELTNDQLKIFFKDLISFTLKSTHSKKTAIEIAAIHEMFIQEFPVIHSNLTTQEIRLICFGGVRGRYNKESNLDSILTLPNFSKWKEIYLQNRNNSTLKLINTVNALPIEQAYDFTLTKNQIKAISELKKIDEKNHDIECIRFSKVIPSFMYDQLVKNKMISPLDFEKYLVEAKSLLIHKSEQNSNNPINNLIEVMYAGDLDSYESKIILKAKQLSIYNFIKNQ